jgi:uncharacterized CHY-type Zn-finger protein
MCKKKELSNSIMAVENEKKNQLVKLCGSCGKKETNNRGYEMVKCNDCKHYFCSNEC